MPEEFNISDTQPVIDGLKARFFAYRTSLKKREIIGICILFVFALLLLIFIGLYGASVRRYSEKTAHTGSSNQKPSGKEDICETSTCLDTASYMLKSMDVSVDPCDDFYTYACGSWSKNFPKPPGAHYYGPMDIIAENIHQKLVRVISRTDKEYPTWSAERKLKQLFGTCINHFERMNNSGTVLLNKIIKPTGGWFVLKETWNEGNWSFSKAFSMAHGDFWTNVIFHLRIVPKMQGEGTMIQIGVGGGSALRAIKQAMYYNSGEVFTALREYISSVAFLVVKDAKANMDDALKSRIKIFVNDVVLVEKNLANLQSSNQVPKVMTLGQLTQLYHHVLNATKFMRYTIPLPSISSHTKILVKDPVNILSLADFALGLSKRKIYSRVMSNYIIWRLMETYLMELSWPYVHASRVFSTKGLHQGYAGTSDYCFYSTKRYMSEAISHVYVMNHFFDQNKKVATFANYLLQGAQEVISNTSWMDNTTKADINKKVASIRFKIGYPDWLGDTTKVNEYYQNLTITNTHLDNILSLNKLHRQQWVDELMPGDKFYDWSKDVTTMYAFYSRQSHTIYVPAASLHIPFYDHRAPHYANFAKLGFQISSEIFRAIFVDLLKWNNEMRKSHKERTACFDDQKTNITVGPLLIGGVEKTITVHTNSMPGRYLLQYRMTETLAYQAYLDWMNDNKEEQKTVGFLKFSKRQLFFLSFAQAHCMSMSDTFTYLLAQHGIVPIKYRFNKAIADDPQFAKAFQCKDGSKMKSNTTCML